MSASGVAWEFPPTFRPYGPMKQGGIMFRKTLVTFFTISLIITGSACQKGTQKADLGHESLSLIPQSASVLVTIHGLTRLHQAFGIEELRAEYPEKFAEAASRMKADVGIDLLDLEALRESGFRPEDPMHVVIGPEASPYLAVFLPGDAEAMALLRSALERDGTELEAAKTHEGVQILLDPQEEMAIFEREGHITIIGELGEDTPGFDAVSAATQLIDDASVGSIAEVDAYQEVMSKFDPDADADVTFFYTSHSPMNLDEIEKRAHGSDVERLEPMVEAASDLLGMDEWYGGGAGYLRDDHAMLEGYSWIGKDNPMLTIYDVSNDPVAFLEDLTSEPLLTYLFRINLAKAWNLVEQIVEADPETDHELREGLADAKREIGVDIESDIIEQIDGNIGLLVNHFGLGGSDAVLFFQVSDPGRFDVALEKMIAAAGEAAGQGEMPFREDQTGGVKFHWMPVPFVGEICFGVVKDHFVATASRARFESMVRGGGGFIESIANADVQAAVRERRSSVFHINVTRLQESLGGMAPMLGPGAAGTAEILGEFSEVSAVVRPGDDGAWQEFRIQGTSPGVWKRLARAIVESL